MIHIIDKVLLPASGEAPGSSLVDVLEAQGDTFSWLMTALRIAKLTDTFKFGTVENAPTQPNEMNFTYFMTDGPFTVFAPTDDAIESLPPEIFDELLTNPKELKKVVLNHVMPGTIYSRGLPTAGNLKAMGGGTVPISVPNTRKMFANLQI